MRTLSYCNSKTISPKLKFIFRLCNFFRGLSDWRYSFLQRDQNSLVMCWTRRHFFRRYKSGLLKFYCGRITAFDFMVTMFNGARGKSFVGSLMVSTQLMVANLGFLLFQLLVSPDILRQVIFHVLKEWIGRFNLPLPNAIHVACSRWVSNPSH